MQVIDLLQLFSTVPRSNLPFDCLARVVTLTVSLAVFGQVNLSPLKRSVQLIRARLINRDRSATPGQCPLYPRKLTSEPPSSALGPEGDIRGVYSITSSARTRTDDGISNPSALAALLLTISSSLVGNSTGRSPGLAPFRILFT
jgi:hypothetical protein